MANTPNKPHVVPLTLAPDGYVYADSIKVARYVPERGTLEFIDRNRQRCAKLGRQSVEVPVADMARLAQGQATSTGTRKPPNNARPRPPDRPQRNNNR